MNAANAMAETWGHALFVASWQGGLFILGVWLLCVAFRRVPPWVKSWLWWIACTQMLLRVFLTVPITVPAAPVPSPVAVADHAVVLDSKPALPIAAHVIRSTPEPERASPFLILMGLWGAGVALGGGIAMLRLLGARRLVRRATCLDNELALTILNDLTDRPPRLLESPEVKCPLLAGYIRPAIVVPVGFAEEHDANEIRMAFAHEVAHLRRRDLWLSLAVATVQTIFFFHPLAWLAAHETAIAREEACDLDVLRLCGESPSAYAHFLFKSAQGRTPVAALGAAYGYRNLRRRITMLKRTSTLSKSSLRRSWLVLIAAGTAAALPWSVVAQSSTHAGAKTTGSAAKAATQKAKKRHSAKTTAKGKKSKAVGSATGVKAGPVELVGMATGVSGGFGGGASGAVPMVAAGMPVALTGGISGGRPGGLQEGGGVPGSGPATAAAGGAPRTGGLTFSRGAGTSQTTAATRTGRSLSQGGGLGGGSTSGGFGGGGLGGVPRTAGFGGGSVGGGLTRDWSGAGGGGLGGGASIVAGTGVAATPEENSGDASLERRIRADVDRGSVEDAIIQVLKASGMNFVIRAKIRPEVMTCHFSNTPALRVLSSILKGSDQALSYQVEGDVIYIVEK